MPRSLLIILCTLAYCSVASSASAQGIDDSNANSLLTTSSTATTTSGLTVAGVIVTGGLLAAHDPSPESLRAFALYLRENAPALERDLTMGAGDSLDDLAGAFGIPRDKRPCFGRALRAERRRLLHVVDQGRVTDEHARRFIALVVDAMGQDERLARILSREG